MTPLPASPPSILVVEHEAATYAREIAARYPDVVVRTAADAATAVAAGPDAEVLVALAPYVTQALIDGMPGLRWIQALTTGTDQLDALHLPPGVVITSGRGIHGPQMAEMALLFMLSLSRNFRGMLDNQARAHWERWPQRLLLGKTAVLLGVGAISEEVAARCKAFGMQVVGVSASRAAAPGFDRVVGRAALAEVLAEADFLIVLVPYTPQTHYMVDAAVLAAMPARGVVINLARGSVIDEAALIAALYDGRIAGAGLDVFEREPLPAQSPLWGMGNVIVTPHIGGMSDVYARQVLPVVIENIGHYRNGTFSAMRNLVHTP